MEEYNRQDVELLEGLYLRLPAVDGESGAGPGGERGAVRCGEEMCPNAAAVG